MRHAIDSVTFEQLLSHRPKMTATTSEQPCLRDMVFDYYCGVFKDAAKANIAAKCYLDELHRIYVQ